MGGMVFLWVWGVGVFALGGTAAVLLVNFLYQFIASRVGEGDGS